MLSQEENELLTRVGPGTAMGELMREYWIPALRGEALEADGAPVRVRLLGENFVAFRSSDGRVGFFDEGCPHRCTSLALARNEDNALTCIFHGWKIDVSGKVVEVPSEPPERRSEFAAKVRVRHYPVREAAGIVWVYLGIAQPAPEFFDFEFNCIESSHCRSYRALLHCSWLQPMEGLLDSSHLGILHNYWLRNPNSNGGNGSSMPTLNTGPHYDLLPRPYGFREAALRDLPDQTCYVRIRELIAPFFCLVPQDAFRPNLMQCAIPVDDEWSFLWYVWYDLNKPLEMERLNYQLGKDPVDLNNIWAGAGDAANCWGQDRETMREGHFTGLKTLNYEDFTVAEAQGKIADRTREYLGYSDSTISFFRRMMLGAIHDHRAGRPVMEQQISYRSLRALTLRVPGALDWRQIDPLNPPQSLPLVR